MEFRQMQTQRCTQVDTDPDISRLFRRNRGDWRSTEALDLLCDAGFRGVPVAHVKTRSGILLLAGGLKTFYKLVVIHFQLVYLHLLSTTLFNLVSAVLWFQHIIG